MQTIWKTEQDLLVLEGSGCVQLGLIEQLGGAERATECVVQQRGLVRQVALARVQNPYATFTLIDGVVRTMPDEQHPCPLRNVGVVRYVKHHLTQGVLLDPGVKQHDERM